jgi:hypothetical protein
VHQSVQGRVLLFHCTRERNTHMGLAKIWRKTDFRNRSAPNPRVGHLIADQFFQLLADRFGKPLGAVGVQVSEYNSNVMRTLFFLFSAAVWAQSLTVYSEFARLDASGHVTSPDEPREILSPALVRNGFTSFQVVIEAEAGVRWRLHVGQNPENAVRVTMYRESGQDLQPVELPVNGDGVQTFWMDLWAAPGAPIQRIKVEPELYINNDWVSYPMEARVTETRVPDTDETGSFCPLQKPVGTNAIPALQFRNAVQDGALAALLPDAERKKLHTFCESSLADGSLTESYFKIRDALFRLR